MTTSIAATDLPGNAHWAADYAPRIDIPSPTPQLHRPVPDHPANLISRLDWIVATVEELSYQVSYWLNQLRDQVLSATGVPVDVPIVAWPDLLAVRLTTEATKPSLVRVDATGSLLSRQISRSVTGMMSPTQTAMALVPLKAICQIPQCMVMTIDLSEPIDTLAIGIARRFAEVLQASLHIVCFDNSPDASQHKAAWYIRDLLRYQSNHHTFSFLPRSDVATAFDDYLAQQRTDLLILSPQLHNQLFPVVPNSVTWKVTPE